jgi:fibronectin type 3 domain-containing protein
MRGVHASVVVALVLTSFPAVQSSLNEASSPGGWLLPPGVPATSGLHFEPNAGQFPAPVRFAGRAAGYWLFLTDHQAIFAVALPGPAKATEGPEPDPLRAPPEYRLVRMRFDGSPGALAVSGLEPQPGRSHYLIGDDPTGWATDVAHYSRVRMDSVWPGIDLVFYGTPAGAVEYDFVVHPSASLDPIRLAFEGATVTLDDEGALVLTADKVPMLVQPPPTTYQPLAGTLASVESAYQIHADGTVGFHVHPYDHTNTLVIDPVTVAYSTYLGGAGTDEAYDIAVDAGGHAYVTGQTSSVNFPMENPFQPLHAGGTWDVFVTKFAADGGSIVYSTYLGGTGSDAGIRLAVDADGAAHVGGLTSSSNFPTLNAYDNTKSGTWDMFVTKLNPAGSSLAFSTYLEGLDSSDQPLGIFVDAAGRTYVGGTTGSTVFPVVNAFQPTKSTGDDGFVTVFAPAGNVLEFSTYFGGTGTDVVRGIFVDETGSIFIAGSTSSTSGFPLLNPFQSAPLGGTDGFVAKFAPDRTLAYSTRLGGDSSDIIYGISVDGDGVAHVAGTTSSANFPTHDGIQPFKSSNSDAFMTRLAAAGDALVSSTFYGGPGVENAYDVAVDADGNTYIAGSGTSTTTILARQAYQTACGGSGSCIIVAKFSPSGAVLSLGTRFGGTSTDIAYGIAVDAQGSIYIAGETASTAFPTVNAYQGDQGGTDAFVAKLLPPPPPAPQDVASLAGPELGQISLAWSEPVDGWSFNVTGYQIQRGATATSTVPIANVTGSIFEYVDANLGNGETWYYRVAAMNAYGVGDLSPAVLGSTFAPPAAPPTPSAQAGPGVGQITVTWVQPASDRPIDAYHVYRGDTSGSETFLSLVEGANMLTYTDSGLGNGVTRHYRVAAVSDAGTGALSPSAAATTFTTPAAPTGLAAQSGPGQGQISLTWNPASSGGTPVTNYRIHSGDTLANITFLAEVGNVLTYTDSGHYNGVTRFYKVNAVNMVGPGTLSSHVQGSTFNTPSAPGSFAVTRGPSGGALSLSWSAPSSNGGSPITGYRIYRGPNANELSNLTVVGASPTSYIDSSLGNGQTWTYRVAALNIAGEGTLSSAVTQTTWDVPSQPLSPAVAAGPGGGTLTVSWTAPVFKGGAGSGGVTGYRIYRGTVAGADAFLTQVGNTTTFQDSGLGDGDTRYYRVAALNLAGEGQNSVTASGTTGSRATAPQAVAAARGPGLGEITLTWQAPASNGGLTITHYRIHRGSQPGDEVFLVQVGNVLSYKDTGLATGQAVSYRVAAVSAAGEGDLSPSLVATAPQPPSAPTSVAASGGLNSIGLTWDAPADNGGLAVTGYRVYGGDGPGPTQLLATLGLVTTWEETALPAGSERFYRVTASNGAGEGDATPDVTATTFDAPGPPRTFTVASGPGPDEISLAWQPPEHDGGTPVTGYRIYRDGELIQETGADTMTHADGGLPPGSRWTYEVAAFNEAAEGSPTDGFTTFAPPAADPPPLPSPRGVTSAAWQGRYAFVFGGFDGNGSLAHIVRYDALLNEVTRLGMNLTTPRHGTSAVWTGNASQGGLGGQGCHPECADGEAIVFGGIRLGLQQPEGQACHPECVEGQQILHVNVRDGVVTPSNAQFPHAVHGTSAVWDPVGQVAYIFGGKHEHTEAGGQACHPECLVGTLIWEYDPVQQELALVNVTFPFEVEGTSAVWDPLEGVAYIFGGKHEEAGGQGCHPECAMMIWEFDPVPTPTLTPLQVTLPSSRWYTSAVWEDGAAYVFGGEDANGTLAEIVRFDAVDQSATVVSSLPGARAATSAVWAGTSAFIFGGQADAGATDEIVRFTPGAPESASAQAGPGGGEITLAWSPPTEAEPTPLVAFRVYRVDGNQLVLHASVGPNTTAYADVGLDTNATYQYRVSAVSALGEGPPSSLVAATTFDVAGAPQELTASVGPTVGEVSLAWQPPQHDGRSPVTSYGVYRAGLLVPEALIGTSTGLAYVDTTCPLGDVCTYRVAARNAAGEGVKSGAASAPGGALPTP